MKLWKPRHWAHCAIGALAAWSFLLHPHMPITCFAIFAAYEGFQDWRGGTISYKDIFDFSVIFYPNLVAIMILKTMEVL